MTNIFDLDPKLVELYFFKKIHDDQVESGRMAIRAGGAEYKDGHIVYKDGRTILVDPYDTKESQARRTRRNDLEGEVSSLSNSQSL